MFGYVRPQKPELLIKDYDAYKAVYCSLCKWLGRRYGVAASLILSYDATFYAILAMSVRGECNSYTQGRCKVNPMKKCNYCCTESLSLDDAAALSVASFYYKLDDDRTDSGFFKRLAIRLIRPFASRWRKKLLKYGYNDFDKIFSSMMKAQFDVESDPACGIDKAAHPSSEALSKIAERLAYNETQIRVLKSFGYYLGKWIYLIDAADDLQDDLKSGGFNPFVNEYRIKEGYDKAAVAELMNNVINEAAHMLLLSYDLIDLKGNQRILENIVTNGITSMQKYVLFDKINEKCKNKSNNTSINK